MKGLTTIDFGDRPFFHLCMEVKFSAHTYNLFERHAPGENTYLLGRTCEKSPVEASVFFVNESAVATVENRQLLISKLAASRVKKVFLHFLMFGSIDFAIELKKESEIELNWIFYGADLYIVLEQYGNYTLYDQDTSFSRYFSPRRMLNKYLRGNRLQSSKFARAVASFDHFCFWNEYDYHLLREHLKADVGYKFFFYFTLVDRSLQPVFDKEDRLLVNHSGSDTGNHIHVLRRLQNLFGEAATSCIVPLSYGRPENISRILKMGAAMLGSKFQPLLEFMPYDAYFRLLSTVKVAIFGHRRQEAGGNVFMLLALGARIFLREDNTMLKWLTGHGFLVYSFENDLKTNADLMPLTVAEMKHNHETFLKVFSTEKEYQSMAHLLDK